MSDHTAKFIVFEGLDGAGKTTHMTRAAEYMTKSLGRKVFVTEEPTVSLTGGNIRDALSGVTEKTPCEMAAMFVMDRIFHNVNKAWGIEKMLADGYDVISDRYYYSSLAYQGSQTDFEWVKNMNIHCPEIRKPDLCVFLDLDPEICMNRIGSGRTVTEIYEKKETLISVRARYMEVFGALDDNVVIVNTDGEKDLVTHQICEEIDKIL